MFTSARFVGTCTTIPFCTDTKALITESSLADTYRKKIDIRGGCRSIIGLYHYVTRTNVLSFDPSPNDQTEHSCAQHNDITDHWRPILIYLRSANLISFEIHSVCEHEYITMCPYPQISIFCHPWYAKHTCICIHEIE